MAPEQVGTQKVCLVSVATAVSTAATGVDFDRL